MKILKVTVNTFLLMCLALIVSVGCKDFDRRTQFNTTYSNRVLLDSNNTKDPTGEVRSDTLKVYVDTDFGGGQTTKRNTSGGIAMSGAHPIKHWSLTQTTIALSSGEAELSGIRRGASLALGLQSIASDLG